LNKSINHLPLISAVQMASMSFSIPVTQAEYDQVKHTSFKGFAKAGPVLIHHGVFF
jgi:hypothetical protein